jgi:ABC-type Fe3+-hydroxamate transport system substrate-binding protein
MTGDAAKAKAAYQDFLTRFDKVKAQLPSLSAKTKVFVVPRGPLQLRRSLFTGKTPTQTFRS